MSDETPVSTSAVEALAVLQARAETECRHEAAWVDEYDLVAHCTPCDAAALAPVLAAERARALREAAQHVEDECPHEADAHAEGTCEVCDLTFALHGDFTEWADRIEREATP
jgi:hypothetical protein